MIPGIIPQWPAPNWVQGFSSTRETDFSSLSLSNRALLKPHFNLSNDIYWLTQTHSNKAVYLDENTAIPTHADAAWTDKPGYGCAVLTGDCLPVLLCDVKGTVVGAAHGGWRGLVGGVLEETVSGMRTKTDHELIAWLGPAIGPKAFEVGADVRDPFIDDSPLAHKAFASLPQTGKWHADIYELARLRLNRLGIKQISGGEHCTFTQQDKFYSYRRSKDRARMVTVIWLKNTL